MLTYDFYDDSNKLQTKSLVTNDSEQRMLMFSFKMPVIKCACSTEKKSQHLFCQLSKFIKFFPSLSISLWVYLLGKLSSLQVKMKYPLQIWKCWKCFILDRIAPRLRGHKIAILGEGEGSPRRMRKKCLNQYKPSASNFEKAGNQQNLG